jgi:hypothetical protein
MNAGTKREIVEREIVEKLPQGIGANSICQELRVGKRRAIDTRQKHWRLGIRRRHSRTRVMNGRLRNPRDASDSRHTVSGSRSGLRIIGTR